MTKDIPKIEVKEYTEHEDGSATLIIECSSEASRLLINEGLIALLSKTVDPRNTEYDWGTDND